MTWNLTSLASGAGVSGWAGASVGCGRGGCAGPAVLAGVGGAGVGRSLAGQAAVPLTAGASVGCSGGGSAGATVRTGTGGTGVRSCMREGKRVEKDRKKTTEDLSRWSRNDTCLTSGATEASWASASVSSGRGGGASTAVDTRIRGTGADRGSLACGASKPSGALTGVACGGNSAAASVLAGVGLAARVNGLALGTREAERAGTGERSQ